MFGDFGHGIILTLFGSYMCYFEKSLARKKTNNEIWNIFFAGRYIILLMGFFSMYTGFIYNDVFSRSVNLFGSQWRPTYNASTLQHNSMLTLNPTEDLVGNPYVAGLDPIWQVMLELRPVFAFIFESFNFTF